MFLNQQWVKVCFVIGLFFLLYVHASACPEALSGMEAETTFIEFSSTDKCAEPNQTLNIKGKLKIPVFHSPGGHNRSSQSGHNRSSQKKFAAVVILHGSGGVDFRGDFYARALNEAGIATLEIDMWEARGIESASDRPSFPICTYQDAFDALQYLSEHPDIDPEKIGVLGFSWGGVIAMAAATETYAEPYGGELRFAAHVAHYPVCWSYNCPLAVSAGTEFKKLTGAPILIQIGEKDDYDEGSGPCYALRSSLAAEFQELIDITAYEGAYHAFDRLEVPVTVSDSFSHLGESIFRIGDNVKVDIIPDPEAAYNARQNAVRFFQMNLNP